MVAGAIDLAISAVLQGIQVWEPAARGKVDNGGRTHLIGLGGNGLLGHVNHDDWMWVLGGSHVVVAGCKPVRDVPDPCPGMVGELSDLYVCICIFVGKLGASNWLGPSVFHRGFRITVHMIWSLLGGLFRMQLSV